MKHQFAKNKPYLLSALLLSCAPGASALDIQWNGFISAVGGKALNSDTTYDVGFLGNAAEYSDEWDFEQDSVVGLRGTTNVNDKLAATVQFLSRANNVSNTIAEWAYLSYDINNKLTLNAGRFRLPGYYYSDFLDVGYAYHWVRPPALLYGGPSSLNGLNLQYRNAFGEYYIASRVWYGSVKDVEDVTFKQSGVSGVNLEFGQDWWSIRGVYNTADMGVEVPGVGLVREVDITFSSFAVMLQPMSFKFISEYANVKADEEEGGEFYASLGYTIGNFTPHYTYVDLERDPIQGAPPVTENIFGVRWDFLLGEIVKKLLTFLINVFVLCFATHVFAEGVVVVNSGNQVAISPVDIKQIFLGKTKTFSDGTAAAPINLNDGNSTKNDFDKKVLNKTPSQMKAYWSRLIFSGAASPIKSAKTDSEIINFVASTPNGIGYIDAANASDKVKVVHKF